MAGPWEKYKKQPETSGNPWEKFSKKQPSGYDDTYVAQGLSGVNEGLANLAGAPVDLANTAIGLGMAGVNKLAGTDFQPADAPFLGSESIKGMIGGAISPETDDRGKQVLRRIGEEVGASVIPGMGAVAKAAKPASVARALLASSAGSGAGAAVANQIAPDNQIAELAGQIAGGIAPGAIARALKNKGASLAASSVDDLKAQASKKYDLAEANGVSATQPQTQKLSSDVLDIVTNEGLVSPTGRISKSYPKVTDSLNMIDDYAKGDMSVKGMKNVRKTLTKAAGSADADEARIGSKLLKKFDDFTSPLATELSDARGIYHKAKKGEMIDTAIELAGSRAGQFSGSGFENALRTEFRALDRKIIKGQLKGISPDEAASIKKVANGGTVDNILRNIGRFAPTGAVSTGVTAGVPFAIGSAIGGPALGAGLSGGAMLGTSLARDAATKATTRNANIASALMRRGALPKKVSSQPISRALIAAQAANQLPK